MVQVITAFTIRVGTSETEDDRKLFEESIVQSSIRDYLRTYSITLHNSTIIQDTKETRDLARRFLDMESQDVEEKIPLEEMKFLEKPEIPGDQQTLIPQG